MASCLNNNNLYIITEYMSEGNLKSFLRNNINLAWEVKLNIAIEIAQGMNYLHNLKYILSNFIYLLFFCNVFYC